MPEYIAHDPRTPEEGRLGDALRAAIDSWPNRAWLVLPGPTDIGSELAGHLTKELAGWRPPARVIADPEELSALPGGALVHDGTAVFDHLGAGWWVTTGSADPIHSEAILEAEPDGTCGCTVIVLWTPEADIQSDIRILLLGKEFEARAAIDRARKLHQPENGCDNPVHTVPDATCPQCCDYCQCCGEAMPCATIRAIDGEDSRFPTPKAGDFTGGVR
ncbi:hypothetical protein [Nocardia farcinica]|uniref:hypothetical protein n=2 Tax=Nocardia farcinica TaxID=37329 RepID=UPI0018931661|nr:hypothetical protein [Nocardia farcinica]MBF6187621.1 hypothetical protein [Nocardia farcinica]